MNPKSRWIVIWLTVLFAHATFGENAASLRVEFHEIDFGDVRSTDQPTKEIEISNIGELSIGLIRATSSCGCTKAELDPNDLKAGASAKLHLSLLLDDYSSDKVFSHVSVETNDPNHPVLQITVRANVIREYSIAPVAVDLGRVKRNTKPTATLDFFHHYGPEVSILRIEAPPELSVTHDVATSTETQAPSDLRARILITLAPGRLNYRYTSRFTLLTNSKRLPEIEIQVSAEIIGIECSITPKVLVFGPVPPGKDLGNFLVEGTGVLTKVSGTTDDPAITVRTEEMESGKRFKIILFGNPTLSPGKKAGKVMLTLYEDDLIETREMPYFGSIEKP